MQNRRAGLDDRPTDRPDDSVSHKAKKTLFIKSEITITEVVGKCEQQ
jgi:hypothetical protein